MAQPASNLPFFQLPREVRDMIFEEFFRSLSVNVHNDKQEKCLARKSNRVTSYCNILRVSKQFKAEMKPYFLRHTTFYIAPDCWESLDHIAMSMMADFKHIVLTQKACHSRNLDLAAATYILECFRDLLKSRPQPTTGFSTIAYDRTFHTFYGEERSDLQRFTSAGCQGIRNLVFHVNPNEKISVDRVCIVSIERGDVVKINGPILRDVKNVASSLCKLVDFDTSMTFVLEKTLT